PRGHPERDRARLLRHRRGRQAGRRAVGAGDLRPPQRRQRRMSGVAVHFGAGNIGRGFVGLLLHRAGYRVVFADVVDELIDPLNGPPSYRVKEVGLDSSEEVVDDYRAINSRRDEPAVVAQIASADIVTTAVGPTVLKFVAPVIAAGLGRRPEGAAPLAVIASGNPIHATDAL